MKKLLLITFLLIPFFGFSQTTKPIEGFLGIKFGSSKAEVTAAMKAKGAVLASSNDESGNLLVFDKVSLGHRETNLFGVRFIDDKAYQAVFMFKAEENPKTIEYYNALISDLNEIYGAGKSTRKYRGTYQDGDGYELTAIETGNADYYTTWVSDNKNLIELNIDSKLNVTLFYEDGPLLDLARERAKAKEKGDF